MEKIWLKSYKNNVPHEVVLDDKTIVDLFEATCKAYPDNRAVTCHGETLSFSEVHERVSKIARGLADLGVRHGDRIALVLPNSIQYPLCVFATHLLGAIVVNINPLYTASEMEYVIANSEPKVVIILDMFSEKLNGFYNKYGIEHIIVTRIADPYPFLKKTIINLVLRYISKVNPKLQYQAKSFVDLYHNPNKLEESPLVNNNDIAFIQYTGATTGHPKGAKLLHRNIVANIYQIYAVIGAQVADLDKQVVISALPLYHIFSLTANLFTFFFKGSENVMIPNAKDLKDLVKTMNKTPFTIFNSLDTLYNKLLEYKPFTSVTHKYYRYGICGGMPTRQSVADAWFKHTGMYPTNCYGLTETSPAVSMSYFDDTFNGSVGYPLPSTEINIIDPKTGHSLGIGEKGIIQIRGPQLMSGYWRNEEQTRKAISEDGWFNTGDMGYIDTNGHLFISGRETEMIIVSGFNVYPAEVELVIDELPEIAEVAVVGYKDEETGEVPHAYIVFHEGMSLEKEQIIKHCRKELARYKIPRSINFVSELPKTLVGKIDKKAIVAKYLANEDKQSGDRHD